MEKRHASLGMGGRGGWENERGAFECSKGELGGGAEGRKENRRNRVIALVRSFLRLVAGHSSYYLRAI